MTRLERYREQLSQLETKRRRLFNNGRYVEASCLNSEIREAEARIREAEEYEESCKPRPISEILSKEEINRMGIIPLMIECHLAADFLTEVAYMVAETCKESGLENISFMPDLQEIIKKTEKFASFIATVSPELCDLITATRHSMPRFIRNISNILHND